MNYLENLKWRYATKKFDPTKKLSSQQWDVLKNALIMTPTSFGLQPYKFVVVENTAVRNQLLEASWNQTQVTEASHYIVLCAKTNIEEKDIKEFIDLISKTRGVERDTLGAYEQMMMGFVQASSADKRLDWAKKQAYIALGFLLDACAQNGIDACPMEGFDAVAYDKILNLADHNLTSVVSCAVGFRSDEDHYAHAKKVRKPESELFVTI